MSNINIQGTLKATGGGAGALYTADLIVEQGNGYIRYNSGIQRCYGILSPSSGSNATTNFPKPFNTIPAMSITRSRQDGWSSNWAPQSWPTFLQQIDSSKFRTKYSDFSSGSLWLWMAEGTWK